MAAEVVAEAEVGQVDAVETAMESVYGKIQAKTKTKIMTMTGLQGESGEDEDELKKVGRVVVPAVAVLLLVGARLAMEAPPGRSSVRVRTRTPTSAPCSVRQIDRSNDALSVCTARRLLGKVEPRPGSRGRQIQDS